MKKRNHGKEGSARRHINLPQSLSDKVDELLYDPVYKRLQYGGLSRLVTELLQNWVDEQGEQTNDK